MAAHPKGHNCPDSMIFSKKLGHCVEPDLETEKEIIDGNDYPERRNHSASNLDFSKRMKKGRVNL